MPADEREHNVTRNPFWGLRRSGGCEVRPTLTRQQHKHTHTDPNQRRTSAYTPHSNRNTFHTEHFIRAAAALAGSIVQREGTTTTTTMVMQSAVMFFALMFLGGADAFVNVVSIAECSSRAGATTMAASSPSGGGGDWIGMTRAQAIQRAAAGSGVLAAGILLGGSAQAQAEEAEMKDEVQQFAELRGQVEKRGRDEVVSV